LDDCVGPAVEQAVAKMKEGEIILLENLRFQSGEDKNDAEFAKQLAAALRHLHRRCVLPSRTALLLPIQPSLNLFPSVRQDSC